MAPPIRLAARALCATTAALLATAAQAAAPVTLACTGTHGLNWRAEAPELVATPATDELGGVIVHLDPASGEWFLERPGSAALTSDGGTFDVRRASDFAAYYEEWVGIDHDTMLRIWGGGTAPLRFSFLSRDYSLVIGECLEPDEPFIFLSQAGAL